MVNCLIGRVVYCVLLPLDLSVNHLQKTPVISLWVFILILCVYFMEFLKYYMVISSLRTAIKSNLLLITHSDSKDFTF